MLRSLACAGLLCFGGAACGQDQPVPQQTQVDLQRLPPAALLGRRVEAIRRQIAVIPVVVLAADAASFTDAVAGWGTTGRYPVLLDDGTPEAAEHIGRFVRAF